MRPDRPDASLLAAADTIVVRFLYYLSFSFCFLILFGSDIETLFVRLPVNAVSLIETGHALLKP